MVTASALGVTVGDGVGVGSHHYVTIGGEGVFRWESPLVTASALGVTVGDGVGVGTHRWW